MIRAICCVLPAAAADAAPARRLSEGYVPPEQRMLTPLDPERYVALGGFEVSAGREAAFERSWADRKIRLGLIEGFRFFSLLRRVDGPDVRGNTSAYPGAGLGVRPDEANYVSISVWDEAQQFEAWASGDAEVAAGAPLKSGSRWDTTQWGALLAHERKRWSSTPWGAVLGMAQNGLSKFDDYLWSEFLRGAKESRWEGLLPLWRPGVTGVYTGESWPNLGADGVSRLPSNSFVALSRYRVREDAAIRFERFFEYAERYLPRFDGFKGFFLLRIAGAKAAPIDAPTRALFKARGDFDDESHAAISVWRDRKSFEAAWESSWNPFADDPVKAAYLIGPPVRSL